jgi:acetolactate synthase-1/2/3 large subunit
MYTTSSALLEALSDCGVKYIFANFGSDHTAIIEALSESRSSGHPIPEVLTCPSEMVALSCAHGYGQITGRAQAVLVHVDCGTQALAGAVHNISRCRVPALIFAGTSPFTQDNELRGTRNEFIHWLQDVPDQKNIVKDYVKYCAEIRTGQNMKQMVARAMQLSHSDPQGPVYLTAAREVLEAEIPKGNSGTTFPSEIDPAGLQPQAAVEIALALTSAEKPLIITSYLGRKSEAVCELIALASRIGIGVLESVPSYMNFPSDHELYLGNMGNEPTQNPFLAEADVVLIIDSDVPWIPAVNRPSFTAKLFHIDVDPLKERMNLWYLPGVRSFRADATIALNQINNALGNVKIDERLVTDRRAHYLRGSSQHKQKLIELEHLDHRNITPEYLIARIREHIGPRAIVLNEGITNYKAINDHILRTIPGTRFTSGGSSLGWHGGAAIGMKLAEPDKEVICVTGDGSFMFSQPSSVYWMARRYKTPFLEIVLNNGGWRAPKLSTLSMHPDGYASRALDLGLGFDPVPDYVGIAVAAGAAFGLAVREKSQLDNAITQALTVVREQQQCAVLDVSVS